jgi:hypothetical protein
MGERAVADIVEESGSDDEGLLVFPEIEPAACDVGKEHRSKGMFEPGVVRARVYKIRETKLANIPETLEDRRVKEPEGAFSDLHIAMDRVLDNLRVHERIFIYIA